METARRTFGIHPAAAMDIFRRQAGTLSKAMLEGAMNAAEAGATRLDIRVNEDELITLTDDGRGIIDKDEVERFFETIGTPHTEFEGKTWAEFRMGRGQLFSFGKNVWRTSEFQMIVDLNEWGLDYELSEGLSAADGCSITIKLYNTLSSNGYRSIDAFKDAVKKQVKFFEMPVFFNGEQINTPPSECTWTCQDEYAYYLFGVGLDLEIYNIGAYCETMSASTIGVVGIIVSKVKLKVNFARTQVQRDCEVWQELQPTIKKNRIIKRREGRARLNDAERANALVDIRDGSEDYSEIKNTGLLFTAQGKLVTLETMRKLQGVWTFADPGDRYADKLMQQGVAICISNSTLAILGYTGKEKDFFSWLLDRQGTYDRAWEALSLMYVTMDQLRANISTNYQRFTSEKLTPPENRLLKLMNGSYSRYWNDRTVCIGSSDEAAAWTDGRFYICIDRDWLNGLCLTNGSGPAQLINVMTHELAHDTSSEGTHVHGPEFHENFHEICMRTYILPQEILADFSARLKDMRYNEVVDAAIQKREKADTKKENALAAKSK